MSITISSSAINKRMPSQNLKVGDRVISKFGNQDRGKITKIIHPGEPWNGKDYGWDKLVYETDSGTMSVYYWTDLVPLEESFKEKIFNMAQEIPEQELTP